MANYVNRIDNLEGEDACPEDQVLTFKYILGHQVPDMMYHKDYKGSLYNFLLLWDDGSET
jgi:hypothetical protein